MAEAITTLEAVNAASHPLSLEIRRTQEINAQKVSDFVQSQLHGFADELALAIRTGMGEVFGESAGAPSQVHPRPS